MKDRAMMHREFGRELLDKGDLLFQKIVMCGNENCKLWCPADCRSE
jgi:hypothetical protein